MSNYVKSITYFIFSSIFSKASHLDLNLLRTNSTMDLRTPPGVLQGPFSHYAADFSHHSVIHDRVSKLVKISLDIRIFGCAYLWYLYCAVLCCQLA